LQPTKLLSMPSTLAQGPGDPIRDPSSRRQAYTTS
jgi:hypothetical protein